MPKFKVQVQQYVEEVGTVEVEAESPEAARDAVLRDLPLLDVDWRDGDDAYSADVYAVHDKDDQLVWER